jgi:hypothetical protein
VTPEATVSDPDEVWRFAADWYRKLDVHVPAADIVPLVAEDVVFQLPEGPLTGREAFRKWYEGVIAIFFDEVHELTTVTVTGDAESAAGAEVGVVVRWEASFWRPPSAWSRRLNMIARQRWTVSRQAATGRLVIRSYAVDSLDPLPGSASLPTA